MPLRQRRLGFALAALAFAASACVSTNEIGGSDKPTPTTTTIPAEVGSLGADIAYSGMLVTVEDVMPYSQSVNSVPRIKVVMRAENVAGYVQHNPDVELLCDESAHAGDWFRGSTWEPNVLLPVNAISQGEVIIGFPLKGDNPNYPVVTCTSPELRVTIVDSQTSVQSSPDEGGQGGLLPRVVVIPIDQSVIESAIRSSRGPNLPLPAPED